MPYGQNRKPLNHLPLSQPTRLLQISENLHHDRYSDQTQAQMWLPQELLHLSRDQRDLLRLLWLLENSQQLRLHQPQHLWLLNSQLQQRLHLRWLHRLLHPLFHEHLQCAQRLLIRYFRNHLALIRSNR